jgi:uncharacterized protein
MNLYDATVPIFTKHLGSVEKWLDKWGAYAEAKKFDPEIVLGARLAPDQYPFVRQVQGACDQAKYTVAKLSGKEPPAHPDTEKTIAELRERVRTVIAHLATFTPADFDGAEERKVTYQWMAGRHMRGGDFLDHFALPNFHFHMTTAYSILRHNGLELGKRDYIHDLPLHA